MLAAQTRGDASLSAAVHSSVVGARDIEVVLTFISSFRQQGDCDCSVTP